MVSVNYRDPKPIYLQIKDSLRRMIETGALPAGGKLPSVRSLASTLAINPNTIQRAYRELENEGYILSIAGKGSFAADGKQLGSAEQLAAIERFRAAAGELYRFGFSRERLIEFLSETEEKE